MNDSTYKNIKKQNRLTFFLLHSNRLMNAKTKTSRHDVNLNSNFYLSSYSNSLYIIKLGKTLK